VDERDLMDMESQYKVAKLLMLRTVWLVKQGQANNLEASIAKVCLAVTRITRKAVGITGTLGYSRELLLEKWMRDAKINYIFDGTGQINMPLITRQIPGFSRR
jgi:acyl-CoA dehydrogenase